MKTIIIGGGASGVFAGINLKKYNPNSEVTILEQNDRVLKKVIKTGNGKCNIMNSIINESFYNNFDFIKNDIDVKKSLEDTGLILKESTLGRIYPYNESSKSVVNILLNNLEKYNVNVITNYQVKSIKYKNNKFIINDEKECDYLIISTGSLAMEKTNGYDLIKSMGINVTSLRPGLVPIITKESTKAFQNIKVKCKASCNSYSSNGEILFKEDGLSGILSLDLSRHSNIGDIISLDLASDFTKEELENIYSKYISKEEFLDALLPKPLAISLYKSNNVINDIKNYKFTVKGFRDFKEAQITIGGVNLNEINECFESLKYPNLYFTGEVLDIDGASGGYNLYFAFYSALKAVNKINDKISKM